MVIRDWDDSHDYDSEIPPSQWNDMVQSIKKGVVNVMDHGAVGDGSTDDYQAIWDAINYAVDNNIRTVYFPSDGIYRIESDIVLNQNRTDLTLLSYGGTILLGATDVNRMLRMNPTTSDNAGNVDVIGLTFDGNLDNLNYTSTELEDRPVIGVNAYSTASGYTDHVRVINCEMKNINGSGVVFAGKSRDCTVVNLYAHDNRMHGFGTSAGAIRPACYSLRSENNVATGYSDTVGSGFDISGGERVLVNGFICKNNGYGFKFGGGGPSRAKVVNGYVLDNNGRGMYTSGDVGLVEVDNVTSRGNDDHGFRFGHAGIYRIGHITSIEDSAGTFGAVYVGNADMDLTIDRLDVFDSYDHGINSDCPNHITVNHLNVRGCADSNIFSGPVTILGGYTMNNGGYLDLQASNSLVKNMVSNDGVRFGGSNNRRIIDCDLSGATTPISGTVDYDVRNIK